MEKKEYHHKDLKTELLEAGILLLKSEGLEGLSLCKVAAACGVSHTAPYRHLNNKEELLAAMQRYVEQEFVAGWLTEPYICRYKLWLLRRKAMLVGIGDNEKLVCPLQPCVERGS